MRIVPLGEEHVIACARIMAENPLWQQYHVTQADAEALFKTGLLNSDAQIMVALIDEIVAGFIWYYLEGTFQKGGYIRLVGVHNGYKGQGIGTELMKVAETSIAAQTPHLFLLSSDFNKQAHQFYDRLGYRIVGELADFAQDGISEMIFYKKLGSEKGKSTPIDR